MTNFWCNFLPIIIGLSVGLVGWYIHRQRTQELLEELEELQSQNARLTHAHDTLNIRYELLNGDYNELSAMRKKLDFHHTNLQIEFAEFKAERQAILPIEVDNSTLNSQIIALESELAAVNSAYADYRNAAVNRVQTAENQVQILRGQYDTMLDSYIEQGQYIKSLSGMTSGDSERFRAEKRADEARISALEIELAHFNTFYNNVKNEKSEHYKQLSEQYETMLTKYVQQGQQLKNMTAEVDEWQSHFENLMQKNSDQDTQILELEETRARIGKELAILRGEFNMQQSRNQTLESELAELDRKYTELETEKAQINSAMTSMNSSYSAKSSNWELRYNELELRHSSLTRRFHDASANNERMELTITGLNAEGIYKYEQLASIKLEAMRTILDKAGSRFRMHDPQSWAAQADMAHKGEWIKLKEYQEYLIGGRTQEQPFVAASNR
jgi:chromosome segregation ATPase